MEKSIASIRREYSRAGLQEEDLAENPLDLFDKWFREALDARLKDANAMILSTADKSGKPSSRIVLLKDFDDEGFVFFTNYQSRKGREIEQNVFGALLFYWAELERQVRIEGALVKTSREVSEAYFHSRPVESQLSALASDQSRVLRDRQELEAKIRELSEKYGDGEIPCPKFWGGYLLKPDRIEFWQGRPGRLHDRFEFFSIDGRWNHHRLYP